ncbi:uncharacterized protein LOC121595948 isoform X3 [Anopheles merus]|uniref:uncharacterized protein LOC121595948 isoform X3 n=1 Tax=Anopheles merus TaxID=30066 RepID=UPI001BE3FCA8|nr:uncharacterized protein LOC121595948 isoform X3 [Anopheles merus]
MASLKSEPLLRSLITNTNLSDSHFDPVIDKIKMDGTMEPLRPASTEEIKQLIENYQENIPEHVQFVLILQNILRMNTTIPEHIREEVSHRVQKTVYIPTGGNFNQSATFVAISREEDLYIMAHSLESPPYELCNAIRTTKYIKWDLKPVFVIGGAKELQTEIHHKAFEFKLKVHTSDFINYWIPPNEVSKLEVVVPNEVQLKPLEKMHGEQINEWWPYRYKTSQSYIESAIQYNGSLGLFDKVSGNLVACVFKNDLDGIAHLYTVPHCSNRGYGSTLVKAMTHLIAHDHKQHVQTFINSNNEKSIRIFEKLGFLPVNNIQWSVID